MNTLSILNVWVVAAVFASGGCSDTSNRKPLKILMDANYALPDQTCEPMTAEDERRAQTALQVMSDFPRHASIYSGAMDVFGHPKNLGDPLRYCVSSDLKDEVVRLTTASSAWSWGLPGLSRLALANELGPRDPSIVRDVAGAAFLNRSIEEGPFSDIRPKARSVLASFGVAAAPWKEEALSSMNAKDAMGTSAAQVAGASGDPEAVNLVAALFRETLDNVPTEGAIPAEPGERLVELSFALGVAGSRARSHAALLVEFLNRDVLKGSHFGMLALPPDDVCRVLQVIGGPTAMQAVEGPRCQSSPAA